jgi:HEPN domain-containing protein
VIPINVLEDLARARLLDARTLLADDRFDAAYYLCGYAVELALKARIVRTLSWAGLPESSEELKIYRAFHTHDLNVLLALTGYEATLKRDAIGPWSFLVSAEVVRKGDEAEYWSPEARYLAVGTISQSKATDAIEAAEALVATLLS